MTSSTASTTPTPTAERGLADRARRRRRRHGTLTHPTRTGVLLVTPAFLFVVLLVVVPLVSAVYISFTNWPLIGQYRFIGLGNYSALPDDTTFWHATLYTVVYTAVVTGPIFLLGYLMAVLVRSNRRGSTLFRTAFFLPYVIGLTTLSFMVLLEVQPGTGAVNAVLRGIGLTDGSTAWLVNTVPATAVVCVLVIWFASGLTMMLLMAAMQGVPHDVYESADLDGVGWFERELHITLPIIRRTVALSLILSVVGSFLAFNQFFILTQGGPGTSTTTVVMWIYQRAFVQLHLGAATTLSLVLVVVVGLISALQFFLLREKD